MLSALRRGRRMGGTAAPDWPGKVVTAALPTGETEAIAAEPAVDGAYAIPPAGSLHEAVRRTVLYSSVFDYPLTRAEIHRFLLAPGGSRRAVDEAVDHALRLSPALESDGEFLYPRGQAGSVATRRRRGLHAPRLWKRARFYALLIWALPYVRMVAITGALAMDNVEPDDDIDLLIVTQPGRLWTARGLILLVGRFARLRGDTLCPNYIISTRALRLEQHDLYTAHELAQMIPLHGRAVAAQFWEVNAWCRAFLPNAELRTQEDAPDRLPALLRALKACGQTLLAGPPGAWLERWEGSRKMARLARETPAGVRETRYTADVCKGHADGHGRRVLQGWEERLVRELGSGG